MRFRWLYFLTGKLALILARTPLNAGFLASIGWNDAVHLMNLFERLYRNEM